MAIVWNIISPLLGIELQYMIAILIGILLISELSTDVALISIQNKLTSFDNNELVFSDDLTQSITKSLEGRKRIKSMRIYALSTTIIQPVIRGALNCQVDKCNLLVRSLNNKEYNQNFGNAVKALMKMWDDMKTDNKIRELNKAYFDDLPSEYNIIIDNELLIIGNYSFTDIDASHVTIDKVFSVSNERKAGQEIINAYIRRFDGAFEYFKKINGYSIKR
jgi:hypothetical protein